MRPTNKSKRIQYISQKMNRDDPKVSFVIRRRLQQKKHGTDAINIRTAVRCLVFVTDEM